MARGAASRARDQYEPVEGEKRRRCSCFYSFLITLNVVVLLAVTCGACYAGYLVYSLRPEADAGAVTYEYDGNMTNDLYPEPEDVSGGDIQYSRIVPYDPSKDDNHPRPTAVALPSISAPTTLGTAARVLSKGTGNKHIETQPAKATADISDTELLEITQSLWNTAQPEMLKEGSAIQLTLGQRLNESIKADLSPNKLFTVTSHLHRLSQTFATFLRLLDNYIYRTGVLETYNEADMREIDDFLDALVATPTIRRLQDFLAEKGLASSDTAAFRQQLWGIWFRLYNRSPKYNITDSSGFEHVFVGEIRKNKVIGLHSWIQLYQQEKKGHLNYHGYYITKQMIDSSEQLLVHCTPPECPRMLTARLKWHTKTLRSTSFFVGTPPEYDLAIYTLCALVRNGRTCAVSVGGARISVHTLETKHMEGVQVADAYIAI